MNKEKKFAEVRITFTNLTKEQKDHLFKAEKELHKAGVEFDTGYDFGEKRRDWEFDWSLKGVKVELKKVLVQGENIPVQDKK